MDTQKPLILVVDDDREIVRAITINLERESYSVLAAYDGVEALEAATSKDISLIIMDIMMPNLDGLSALMKLREQKNIPVILLSAKTEYSDKILGLSMGADDYISKPFNSGELIARVKSQLRRYTQLGGIDSSIGDHLLRSGGLCFNTETKELTVDGESVRLTATEMKILELLLKNAGRVFPTEEIYERIWDVPAYSVENTVMVHIRRIREKIEINPSNPEYLKVVWGVGYKIEKLPVR